MTQLVAPASSSSGTRPRVLVVFPGALGDLMCLGPALAVLAARHPGAALELVAREALARFAVGRMGVERAHSIDRREVALLFDGSASAVAEASAFFGVFDRIYSFFASHDETYRRSLVQAARNPEFVTFHSFRPTGEGHVAAGYLQSLSEVRTEPRGACLRLLPGDLAAARLILKRHRLSPGRFILVVPGSGGASKRWPAENFAALMAAAPLPSVAVVGPAEAECTDYFSARGLIEISGVGLAELSGIAGLARAFVGNDSGTSHLAASTGTPGVVLFGPSDPARWRPLGEVTVLRRDPLRRLAVAPVVAALAGLIRGAGVSPSSNSVRPPRAAPVR